jgi:hypothetical protein
VQLPPLPPVDQGVPELQTLLGSEAGEILSAALDLAVAEFRPTYIRYAPGASATVTYSVRPAPGAEPLVMAAYVGPKALPGAIRVSSGPTEVTVWRFPHDPGLPGLPHAADPALIPALLGEVGVTDPVRRVRTRAYRPRRRAVIEVETDAHRLFFKVVRPVRIGALQESHRVVSRQVRAPRSLGFSAELGIAVLEPIEGETLRQAVGAGREALPGPAELTALLDALPETGSSRPGILDRLAAHRTYLQSILPSEAQLLERIVGQMARTEPAHEPAHNDFHSSQVLVRGKTITGLIDIDTVGPGSRTDDHAMLLAHLHSLALGGEGRYARYGARLLPAFEREAGRNALRHRIAAAMVGFATAPFRNQQLGWPQATAHRLRAAAEWLV